MAYKNMRVELPKKIKVLRSNGHEYVWHIESSEYQIEFKSILNK